MTGSQNETWGNSPIARPKSPISSELAGMLLYPSPKTQINYTSRSKSPGVLRKSMSFGGAIKHSPSLSGIKNSLANFNKLRNNDKQLKGIPDLGA